MANKTYTLDADFDQGVLIGVEHDSTHDQLQLSKEISSLPFIWIPNMEGTISKVNTDTGIELGRYIVSPTPGSPSRTTVDLDGNCWVGNRTAGTVVKTGQFETGFWEDRNGNGICDTSTGSTAMPWAQDECVLKEIVLFGTTPAPYTPGTYPGPYSAVYPRALAVDKNNNIWAGVYTTNKYYYINGTTGQILRTIDVSSQNHHPYGAVIDKYGMLWSSNGPENELHILKIDVSTDPATITKVSVNACYGMGLDYQDHLFVSGWTSNQLARINIITATVDWQKSDPTHLSSSRGVVCTEDNHVWVANSGNNTVTRYDNDGNFVASISVGSQPTGVAIDNNGKVWVCDLSDEAIHRINPATNTVDLSTILAGSQGHYSYSDMTGVVARTITTDIGNWNVIFDSGDPYSSWGYVSWNSNEPTGTSVTVKVRSSNDQINWSSWEIATNGIRLQSTPPGRYIQIETTLQIISGDVSPILYDLTVKTIAQQKRGFNI